MHKKLSVYIAINSLIVFNPLINKFWLPKLNSIFKKKKVSGSILFSFHSGVRNKILLDWAG